MSGKNLRKGPHSLQSGMNDGMGFRPWRCMCLCTCGTHARGGLQCAGQEPALGPEMFVDRRKEVPRSHMRQVALSTENAEETRAT